MEAEKTVARNLSPVQEDYLEVETHCCLCGTELIFEHQHDDTAAHVKEKAHCPTCHIQLKEKEFLIH